jgi:CheY-like chemotaxis protein
MEGVPDEPTRGGIAAAQVAGAPGVEESVRRPANAKLAHDINNPLAIVLSNLEFAIGELGSLPGGEGIAEALGEARQAVERIRDLVASYASAPEGAASTASEPEPAPESTRLAPPKARVLVVDDEPMLGRAISRGLREHEVIVVTSGAEALALFERGNRFDAILCDLMMPTMPGFELYEQVRMLAPEQAGRMVFMTGGATTTRAREFVESRRESVLQKPLSMDTLRETVAQLLAMRRRAT